MAWKFPITPPQDGDDESVSPRSNGRSILGSDPVTGATRRIMVNSDGSLIVQSSSSKRLIWDTNIDWNKGTIPPTIEISGTGSSALLRLKDKPDNSDNVDYEIPVQYTLSDAANIEVADGEARLKALSGGSAQNWPFTVSGDYTVSDAAKIEVVGGVARLKKGTTYGSELKMYWKLDGNANDATLNANNGISAVTWGTGGHLGTDSASFNGTTDKIYIQPIQTNLQIQAYDDFSVSLWFYIITLPGVDKILVHHECYGLVGWGLRISSSNQLVASIENGTAKNASYQLTSGHLSQWNHAVMTVDRNGLMKLYLNGVQVASTNVSALEALSLYRSAQPSINMGAFRGASWFFAGKMDDMGFYKGKVLSQDEVIDLYNSGTGRTQELYVTDNPSVNNTTGYPYIGNVSTFAETATLPLDCAIKYHVTSDDGTTWKYWTGLVWAVTDGSYTQANTSTDIAANIQTLGSNGTFKFKALLKTTNGWLTPELDNIQITTSAVYSTNDNLYVDTKGTSHVAPSLLFDWLTVTVSSVMPYGTDIRLLFSVDGRVSWLTWSGSAWVAPTSDTTRTDATSITDAQTNFSLLPLGSNTLDIRLFLYSSDSARRPQVSNINVTSDTGFETNGLYETSVFDSSVVSQPWGIFDLSKIVPSGTDVIVKTRASNSLISMGSYGSPLVAGSSIGLDGQFIQFSIELTGTAVFRPSVDYISARYITPFLSDVAP